MYPRLFIIGMVKDPVATTLETVLPDTVPKRLEATTATQAPPPTMRPPTQRLIPFSAWPAPVALMVEPKMMNIAIVVAITAVTRPHMPRVVV